MTKKIVQLCTSISRQQSCASEVAIDVQHMSRDEACAIGRVDPADSIGPILGYLVALLAGLIIVAIVPWISTGFL